MPRKMNLELKVGIFAFIGLVILTWVVFSISEIYIFSPGYQIQVVFNFASGIAVGAPVRVAGIQAGEVRDIKMNYEQDQTKIILSVWLDEGVQVPADSHAYVNILGLIGDTYLEIIPGEDYAHLLKDGDALIGRNPLSTESMMEAVYKVADDFDNVLGSIDEVLDGETKLALKETIHNLRDFSNNLKVISGRLERGEGKLGAWLKVRKKSEAQRSPESKDKATGEPKQNF